MRITRRAAGRFVFFCNLATVLTGLCLAQSSATTVGLAAYWPFDETSGTTAHDASGGGNNGTLQCNGNCTAPPAWSAGEVNGGLAFTDNNDVVSVPDSPELRLTNQFTVAFWVNKAPGATNVYYVGKGASNRLNGYAIATGTPGNYLYINLFNNGGRAARCTAPGVVQDQTWQHFAITYDGSVITIYVNGVLANTCNAGGSAGVDNSPLNIGGTNAVSPDGTLDEVRIYNRALSAQEIGGVYNDPGLSASAPVSVAINPVNASLSALQTQQFVATVTGSSNTAVTWSVSPSVGAITSNGFYTAPASINSPATLTVTATSVANPSMSASSQITLQPTSSSVSMAINPVNASLSALQTQQFAATVTGISNTAVTWSVSPPVGAVSSSGLYTAPGSINSPATVTVTATSVASPSMSASSQITLQPASSLSVVINPVSASLSALQTQQFAATVIGNSNTAVTWSVSPSVGAVSRSGLYIAPALIITPATVTVTATSVANPSISASSQITLQPLLSISLAINPPSAALSASQTQQFLANLTGIANTAVTWSLSPALGTISNSGLYTAPAGINGQPTVTITATSVANPAISSSAAVTLASAQNLATFQLPELFGVTWPDQPIEFRYDGGTPPLATTRMIGPNGSEVPYQWVTSCSDATALNGCIAVRSNLAPNTTDTWTLQSGAAPSATPINPVQAVQVGQNWEIKNGLTGVRILATAANPAPWTLAPIQGILLPNGTWTGAGKSPNMLYSETNQGGGAVGCVGCVLQTPIYNATGYSVTVTDAGPLKVVINVTYTFNRPQYYFSNVIINTAGAGHYTMIVTMYANSKSILIDEDSDMQFAYYLPVYKELLPDIARFRGHDGLDTNAVSNPVCGYEASVPIGNATSAQPIVVTAPANLSNGQSVLIAGVSDNSDANGLYYAKTAGYPNGQFGLFLDPSLSQPVGGQGGHGGTVKPGYRGQTLIPTSDAYIDVTYTGDRPAFYTCSATGYRKMLTNYPAATHAAGWYDELYRSNAGANAPVIGIYVGRASQQIHSANGPSMPGIYSSNRHWITGKQDAGIQVENLLRGPDASLAPLVHRNWGIWVSTQADLLPTASHQPIADEQNTLTGINLSRLYTYQLVYPDPPGGWTWQYLSANSANQLISEVRNGTSVCGTMACYYTLLKNSEGSIVGSGLLNMWQGNSANAVQAALNTGIQVAQNIGQTLATGDNHFDGPLGYYQLGLQTIPETALLNAIIMDANTTLAQKTTAKAILAFFGCLFWDDDWFPIDNPSGESDGLANQIQQYLQDRLQSVASDPSQPFLASVLPTALTYPGADFASFFSATGAAAGSTHYQSDFFEPLILSYQNLTLDGNLTMTDPKWVAYANWELSIQTPPEPRFGNVRKGYSNGDGNTEADVRPGMLGTALYPVNPNVAGNLMWAWQQSNSPTELTEDSQFVTTLAAIDPTIPAIAPQLGSINIPGYHTAERHAFGTPNETALWFINGGFYSSGGHRHADDGQVSIYAHSAPLAIDWNANLYLPQTPGRFMHNSIVFDTELHHLWSADSPALNDADILMQNPTNTEFGGFQNSTTSTGTFTQGDGTVWTRTVRTMDFDPSYPIIYVADTFSGPSSGIGKTLTWNLMANGPVSTPVGPITPTARMSAGCQSPAGALPSNGTVSGLGAGLQQFNFTGFNWPQHATNGINWDLFTLSNTATQQFSLGNWGHGCHPSRESVEYQNANGAKFAEVQDILRVHDSGPFTTIILPYRKTETPNRTVTQQACGVQIVQGSETTCFNNSAATYSNGTTGILTVYDSSSQSAFGMTAAGGPQEVTFQPNQIVWTVSGAESGPRNLTLQGNWFPHPAVAKAGNTFNYSYAGGLQTPPATITFSTTP